MKTLKKKKTRMFIKDYLKRIFISKLKENISKNIILESDLGGTGIIATFPDIKEISKATIKDMQNIKLWKK